MKGNQWIARIVCAALLFTVYHLNAQTNLEYGTIRFDGPSSRIMWPDGTAEKIGDGEKLHGTGDTRLWYLTVGMNKMAKKGFVLSLLTYRDAYLVRMDTKQRVEYASTRCSGPNTSVIWPDGTSELVAAKKSDKPDDADSRMWYLTRAMNVMSKRGFSFKKTFAGTPILPTANVEFVDIWMERTLLPEVSKE